MSFPPGKASDKNKRFQVSKSNEFVTKSKSNDNPKPAARSQSGWQSFGKPSSRRIPPPANLPSLRSEIGTGNGPALDPNVPIVPSGSHGWSSGGPSSSSNTTPANQNLLSTTATAAGVQIQNHPATPIKSQSAPQDSSAAVGGASSSNKAATWSTITAGIEPPNLPNLQDFPRLSTPDGKSMTSSTQSGTNVSNKKPQQSNDQSSLNNNVLSSLTNSNTSGPSLRPANIASWREGGGRAQPLLTDQKDVPTNQADLLSRSQQEYPSNNLGVQNSSLTAQNNVLLGNGPANLIPPQMPSGTQFLRMYPPQHPQLWGYPQYSSYGPPFGAPPQISMQMHRQPFGVPPPQMHQYQTHHHPQQQTQRRDHQQIDSGDYKTPNILHQKELDALSKLTDNDTWANASQSVDYSEKLQFSDNEDNADTTNKSEHQTRQRTNIHQQQPYYTQRQNSDSGYSQSRYNTNRQSNQQLRQQTQPPYHQTRLIQDDEHQWKQLQEKTNTELQNTLAIAIQRRVEEERKLDADTKKKTSSSYDDEQQKQQQRRETDSKSPAISKNQQQESNTNVSGSKHIPGYQTRPLSASTGGNGNSQTDIPWRPTTSRTRQDTNESQTFSMASWHEQMESFNYASLHEKPTGAAPTESDHENDSKKYSRSRSESSSRSQSQVGIPITSSRNRKNNDRYSIQQRPNPNNNTEQQRDIVDHWDVGTSERDKDNDEWENLEDNVTSSKTHTKQTQRNGVKIQQDPFADVDTTSNRYRQQQQQSNIDKRNNFQQSRGNNNRSSYNTQSSREQNHYGRKQQSERNNNNNISTTDKSKSRLQVDPNNRQQHSSGARVYNTDNSKSSTPDAQSVNNEFEVLAAPQRQNSSNQKNQSQSQRETTEMKQAKQPWKSLSPTRISDHDSEHLMLSSKDPTPSEAVILKSQQRDLDNRGSRNDDQQQYQYNNQQQQRGGIKQQTRFNQQNNTSTIQPLMSLPSDTKHLRQKSQQSQQQQPQQRQQDSRRGTRDNQYQQQERHPKDYDQRSQSHRMTQNDYYGQESGEYDEYEYEEYDTQGYHHPGVNTRQNQQQMRSYPQLHHHRGYPTLGTYGRYRRGGRHQYGSTSGTGGVGQIASASANINNARTKKYSSSRTAPTTTTKPVPAPVSTTQRSSLSKQSTIESTPSTPTATTEQSSPKTQQTASQRSSTTKSTPSPKQISVQQTRRENAWVNNTNTNTNKASDQKNVQASIDIANGGSNTPSVDATIQEQPTSSLNEQIPSISDTEQKSISTAGNQEQTSIENKSQTPVSGSTAENIAPISRTHTPTEGKDNINELPQTNESIRKNVQLQQHQRTNNHRGRYNDQRQPPRYRNAYARNMQQEYQAMQSANSYYGRRGQSGGRLQMQDVNYYYEQLHSHQYNHAGSRYGNQSMGGQDTRPLNTRGRGRGATTSKRGNLNRNGSHRSTSGVVGTSDTIANKSHQSFVNGSRGSQVSLSANSTDDKEEDWETASESSAKMRNGNNYERSGNGVGLVKERENNTIVNEKLGNRNRTPPRKSYSSQRPANNRYQSGYNDNRRYYSYDRATTQKSGRGTNYKAQQPQLLSSNEQNRQQQQSTVNETQSQKQSTSATTGSTTNSQQLQPVKKDYRHSVEGYDLNNVAGVVKVETLPAGALEEEGTLADDGEEFSVVMSRKERKEQKAAQLRLNAAETKDDSSQQHHDQLDITKSQQQRTHISNNKQAQDTSQTVSLNKQDEKSSNDATIASTLTSNDNDPSSTTNVNDTTSSSRTRAEKSVPPRFNSKSSGSGQHSSSSYYYDQLYYYYGSSYDNRYYNSYDTRRQGRNHGVSKQSHPKNTHQRYDQSIENDENQQEKKNEHQKQVKTNIREQLGSPSVPTTNSTSMDKINNETLMISTTNNTLPNVMTNIQMWDNSVVNETSSTASKIIEKPSSSIASSFPGDKKFAEHQPNESSNNSGESSLPHHQRTAADLGSESTVRKSNETLARAIKPPVSDGKQARDKIKAPGYEKNDSMSLDSNQLFSKEVNFMTDYDDKNTPGDDYNQKINKLKTIWDASDHSGSSFDATISSMINMQQQENLTNTQSNDTYSQLDSSNNQQNSQKSSSNVNVSSSSSVTNTQQGSNIQDDSGKQSIITPTSSTSNINPNNNNNNYTNQNMGTKNEQKNICTVKPTQQVVPNIQDNGNVVDAPFPTFHPTPPLSQQQIITSISSPLAPPQSMQQQPYSTYPVYENTLLPQRFTQNRYSQSFPVHSQPMYMSPVPSTNLYHNPHSQQAPISAAQNNSMPPPPPPMSSYSPSINNGSLYMAPQQTMMMSHPMMTNRNIQSQQTNSYYPRPTRPQQGNTYNTQDASAAAGTPPYYQAFHNQSSPAIYSQGESYNPLGMYRASSIDRNDHCTSSMLPLQAPPPPLRTSSFPPTPTSNQPPSLVQSQNPQKYQLQQGNSGYLYQHQPQYGGNGNHQQQHQQGPPGPIGNNNRMFDNQLQQPTNIGSGNIDYMSLAQHPGNNNNLSRSRPMLSHVHQQQFFGGSGNNQKSSPSFPLEYPQVYNQPQHYSGYTHPHPQQQSQLSANHTRQALHQFHGGDKKSNDSNKPKHM
ncbi:unnamed protein product [Didymodactylos carnosus]|uniref:BAT2 N-terminal domain-containing protein n=1 Tax=Didymodactylos carnosus TaxID=1234261 RepID=A0A813X4E2_9BILA|nr:unnamed protein product [Didymodactylos carnosus]CAF3647317.1 unnamed protein product [Didymodactylos carnosus]